MFKRHTIKTYLCLSIWHWVARAFTAYDETSDRLCGLVVRVPGANPEVPGSIPGTTIFSE
jgi:hypothetical protein